MNFLDKLKTKIIKLQNYKKIKIEYKELKKELKEIKTEIEILKQQRAALDIDKIISKRKDIEEKYNLIVTNLNKSD